MSIIHWTRDLFMRMVSAEMPKDKVKDNVKKKRVYLNPIQKNNLVIDRNIFNMKYSDLSRKYNVSKSTAHGIVFKANNKLT